MAGFRKSPKYFMVKFLDIARTAVLDEADVLVEAGVINNREDIFYFSFDEVIEILEGIYNKDINKILEKRKRDFTISPV